MQSNASQQNIRQNNENIRQNNDVSLRVQENVARMSVRECGGEALRLRAFHALGDVEARARFVHADRCKCVRMRVRRWVSFYVHACVTRVRATNLR